MNGSGKTDSSRLNNRSIGTEYRGQAFAKIQGENCELWIFERELPI